MDNTGHIRTVHALRVSTQAAPAPEECRVVVEEPMTIQIAGVGDYTLMCTPSDVTALAVGFAFTEGLISGSSDIDVLHRCDDDPNTISMRLSERCLGAAPQARNLIVASSCGMCGLDRIERVIESLPVSGGSLQVPLALILSVFGEMKDRQTIFAETGGAHAAAILTADGRIAAFAEDIGRHNALDKAIGKCVLEEKATAGCGVAFSGRASFEIVAKSARAGIELIAAVSAPSSLAIETARRCGITLCGFVRGDHATVYTHEDRIL